MPITNLDTLIGAMTDAPQDIFLVKYTMPVSATGQIFSYWTQPMWPAAGVIPGAAAICTKALLGALPFTNATGGKHLYAGVLGAASSVGGTDLQIHDRLGHMAGLSGTDTGVQTVNLDISGSSDNLVNRRGAADYADIQWWLEWYANTGSTAVNFTVTYTNAAGQSGRTVTTTGGGATTRLGRMVPIFGSDGEFIRSIQSVQLTASTGTVGNFGVTATRAIAGSSAPSSQTTVSDFQRLGLPRIHDDACLFVVAMSGGNPAGDIYGMMKLFQG